MNGHIRKFISVTLTHVEKRGITPEQIVQRVKPLFKCTAIIVATEEHQKEGIHYHVAIQNENASRHNATQKIRNAFPEFPGKMCNVQFNKGIKTIIGYITKEDKKPIVWGQYSLEEILNMGENARKHKRYENEKGNTTIITYLKTCDDWYQVYENQTLNEKLLKMYTNMRKIYEDYQVIRNIKTTIGEKLVKFLQEKEWPQEYTPEEISEKYIFIDWVACQLIFERPIKTRQLFIYGEPSTQKTLIIHLLAKVLRIYFASARKNDFSGADDFYDLWVFDEFHEPDAESSIFGATEEGTAYANTLLKVLDGQECRLDTKYGKIFTKKTNVPIIMIANRIPDTVKRKGAFQERFMRLPFKTNVENLKEERVIATLWGCIQRRICRNINWQKGNKMEVNIHINYNEAKATQIKKRSKKKQDQIEKVEEEIKTRQKEIIKIQTILNKKEKTEKTIGATIEDETIGGETLSLINYAIIPLEKGKEKKEKEESLLVFNNRFIGGNFLLKRTKGINQQDYMVWPIKAEKHDQKNHEIITMMLKLKLKENKERNNQKEGEEGERKREIQEKEKGKEKEPTWLLNLGPIGRGDNYSWSEKD